MIRTLVCIAIGTALCLTATCGPARAETLHAVVCVHE
jgi:hypothetical protein